MTIIWHDFKGLFEEVPIVGREEKVKVTGSEYNRIIMHIYSYILYMS
jgi:hypothetical protein